MPEVKQHGGDHYKAEYQHWDFVIDTGMQYLPGCATKYVSRWWKKNGLDDLLKARTYVEKMMVTIDDQHIRGLEDAHAVQCFNRFVKANALPSLEAEFTYRLLTWRSIYDLQAAMSSLDMLIVIARGMAGPQGGATGQARPVAAATGAAAPGAGLAGATQGATQGAAGQGAAGNNTTAPEVSKSRGLIGLEHPFGYEGEG